MPAPATTELPLPKSWDEFEDIILDLYKRIWDDPNAERNGRSGQGQNGVDVYGVSKRLGGYVGVQCKRYAAGRLKKADILKEVRKAERFKPPLREFVIATTEQRDSMLQEAVRVIDAEHIAKGGFTVHIVFWEDICSNLTNPENSDVLFKYYVEWIRLFEKYLPSSQRLVQVSGELEAIQLQLRGERERSLQGELNELRQRVNSGYSESARASVLELAEKADGILAESELDRGLVGSIYRLAASVLIDVTTAGECRAYLTKAAQYASGNGLIDLQILESLLLYRSEGPQRALQALERLEHAEVKRICFGICLENNDLQKCRLILSALGDSAVLESKDWLRLLALYYAALGEFERAQGAVDRLTADSSAADHFMVAGYALSRLAYQRHDQFCHTHNVSPAVHLAQLDLDTLVDQDLRSRARDTFVRAFTLFKQNDCPVEACYTLESALLLDPDDSPAPGKQTLIDELANIDPRHPLVVLQRTLPVSAEYLNSVISDQANDPLVTLALVRNAALDMQGSRRLVKLIRKHGSRFRLTDDIELSYRETERLLLRRAGVDAAVSRWINEVPLPERYAHHRLLWRFQVLAERQSPRAQEVIGEALSTYPDHPEVLVTATLYAQSHGDHGRALASARRLASILPGPRATEILLSALFSDRKFGEYLEVAEKVATPRDPVLWRRARAYARLGLRQLAEAQEDFEFLQTVGAAEFADLVNLARIHLHLGEYSRAIAVLEAYVKSHLGDPEGYVELSQLYLMAGHKDDALRWAYRAYERFEGNQRVAFHLARLGLQVAVGPDPRANSAFREFMPGGKFDQSGYFEPHDMEDLRKFLLSRRERQAALEAEYRSGRISAMTLCHMQASTLMWFHRARIHDGVERYAAAGDQSYAENWLILHSPKEVVLDYSALLTLWTLYGATWINRIRSRFNRVWIPASLLEILVWELAQLNQSGQVSRYRAQKETADAVNRLRTMFEIEPYDEKLPEADYVGYLSEAAVARKRDLLYLNEYAPAEDTAGASSIGLRCVAEVLLESGVLERTAYAHLTENAKTVTPDEIQLKGRLLRGAEIVADVDTLETLAQHGALRGFCNYFGRIHLAHVAWRRLIDDVATYEFGEESVDELRRLQASVGTAVRDKVLELCTVPDEERVFGVRASDDQIEQASSDEPTKGDDVLDRLFEYLDELTHAAYTRQAPIWTDDRWTSKLYLNERQSPYIFGTDTFLEWERFGGGDRDAAFSDYERLVEWRYMGLPMNADYMGWLPVCDIDVESAKCERAVALYRDYVVQSWQASQVPNGIRPDFAILLIETYHQRIASLLRNCREKGMSSKACGRLLGRCDLTKHTDAVVGREPYLYGTMILNLALGTDLSAGGKAREREEARRLMQWFDSVLLDSGVGEEEINEAWFTALWHPMTEAAGKRSDNGPAGLPQTVVRLFDLAPDRVKAFLLASSIGSELKTGLTGVYRHYVSVTFTDNGVQRKLDIPMEVWDHDLRRATERFLLNDSCGEITEGAITLRGYWKSQGSLFLRRDVTATEAHQMHPDEAGNEDWLTLLRDASLYSPAEKIAFWRQGYQKLSQLNIPTKDWLSACDTLETGPQQDAISAITRLQQTLVGHNAIARDYFAEAAELGTPAVHLLLELVTPAVVRSWLAMPRLDWSSPDGLLRWVQTQFTEAMPQGLSPRETLSKLSEDPPPSASSVFIDSIEWQTRIQNLLGMCGAADFLSAIDELVQLAEGDHSLALKSNILSVVLLTPQLQTTLAPTPSLVRRIQELLIDLCAPLSRANKTVAVQYKLNLCLAERLYMAWSLNSDIEVPESVNELAYLAFVGSALITDWLFLPGAKIYPQINELAGEISSQIATVWFATDKAISQPNGWVQPRWIAHVNYPLAHLLKSLVDGSIWTAPLQVKPIQQHLMNVAVMHRVTQAFAGALPEDENWLASGAVDDIAEFLTALVRYANPAEPESMSDSERIQFVLCADKGMAQSVTDMRFDQFEKGGDSDALLTISLCFVGLPSGHETAYVPLRRLMGANYLERIKLSPDAYGELLFRLLQALSIDKNLPDDIKASAQHVLFEIPRVDDTFLWEKLINTHSVVLARKISYGDLIPEIVSYLDILTADESIPVSIARQGLRPFIFMWPQYPAGIQSEFGAALLPLINRPRFVNLWECVRFKRDYQPNIAHGDI